MKPKHITTGAFALSTVDAFIIAGTADTPRFQLAFIALMLVTIVLAFTSLAQEDLQ
jgi:hypothetical protein